MISTFVEFTHDILEKYNNRIQTFKKQLLYKCVYDVCNNKLLVQTYTNIWLGVFRG